MQCFNPISITVKKDGKSMDILVPCNKCLGCRIARRREWSVRILHELYENKHCGVFITLTYNNESLPENGTLVKRDVQLFWKRLRKWFDCGKPTKRKSNRKRIRYYMCGEYGEIEDRPHYHAIVFGLDIEDLEPYHLSNKKIISKVLEKVWTFGYNQIGTVTSASAQYVAGYIEKKLYGDIAEEEYKNKGRIAPYSAMSQGIGRSWIDKNKDQISQNLELTIKGIRVGIPRYYKKRAELDPDKLYELGSEARKKKSERYSDAYDKGGLEAADRLRRDIASYRYEGLKARYQSKRGKIPLNGGALAPPSTSVARELSSGEIGEKDDKVVGH